MKNKEKYIDLLLNRCLDLSRSNSLFISYNKVNEDFAKDVIISAIRLGITDIGVDLEDNDILLDKLTNESLDEIKKDPYFNKSNWDIYAEKKAAFLMLETEFPNLLKDIPDEKISLYKKLARESRPLFRKYETNGTISWNISALPNQDWADDLFKGKSNSLELLSNAIEKVCMLDKENPIEEWNNFLKYQVEKANYLNSLNLSKLIYKNSLGTNLEITLPDNYLFVSASSNSNVMENLPSYEIFTSPHYLKTNGIVYSSKPLLYGGKQVNDFYIEFKDGKVVNYDAKEGKEILKGIIESDSNSCYLGEAALVNYNSPISNTNLVFKTTLFDENAACHLALGDSFPECIKDGLTKDKKELLDLGLNDSTNHVDFMIGTKDLEITGITKDNNKITIMKDGNLI